MNKKFFKRVSLILTLFFSVSNFYCIQSAKADTAYPYTVSTGTNSFQKPNIYTGQVLMADEYQDTPGWTARAGYNEATGWKFYQTVMFPANQTDSAYSTSFAQSYDDSITGAQAMANANYGIDSNNSDDQDSHYYLNYKFKDTKTDGLTYNYSDLIYYRIITMYGSDPVRIGYKIDSSSFTPASGGAVMWKTFPSYSDYDSTSKFVHDYHIATITANPTHTAPTADFYFDNGDSTENVSAGQTVQVIDGTASDTYDNTSSLFWSTYYTMSNYVAKHGSNHSLTQSYTYDDAVITGSSWSIYDGNGNNVTSQFHTALGTEDSTNAATNFSFTVDDSITPGTYYVGHSVTDNWDGKSQEQRRTFTVSPTQQYNLTVHYIDQTGNEISGTEVDNAPNPYTPAAPSGYSLTGNYRTSATGSDSAFNHNNGTEINVDLSTSNQVVYVVCSAIISQSKLNAHYVDSDTESDITDVSNVSNPYMPHAPQGYSLTGNYRTSSTGTDISYTNSIAAATGVSDIYIMCKKVNSEYTLNVTYVDENNNNNVIGYGDTVYYDDSSTNLKHSNGSEFTTYLPDDSKTPKGYTLDTSKYFDPSLGYFIEFDSPESMANENGHSDGKTANLQIYCMSSGGNPTPTPVNNPPTVALNLPPTVALGDDLPVNAVGNDSDGDTLTYSWNTPSGMAGDLGGIGGTVEFDNPSDVGQEKTFTVTVNDGKGGTATATAVTTVVEPQPTVSINIGGTLKENRKVTLSETSYSGSKSYKIDNSKITWAFYDSNNNPIDVTNAADSGIVESLDNTTGTSSMNVLFTKAGTYTVKCTVYNNYGATATDTKQIAIVQDVAPIADFTVPKTVYRDPDNGNLATLQIKDNSYSSDGDIITKRIWLYAFDSNNDGNFNDETFYVYDVNLGWKAYGSYADIETLSSNPYFVNSINGGNLTSINIVPQNFNRDGQMQSHVGKYRIVEIVQESFGQDTLQSLVTSKDCRVGIESTH